MTLNSVTLLAGGAGIAALAGGWSHLKAVLERLQGVILPTMELDYSARMVFGGYCWRHLRHTATGPFTRFDGRQSYIKPLGKWGTVAYRVIGSHTSVFWKGWRPLFVRMDPKDENLMKVRYIRGTFDPERLMAEVTLAAATTSATERFEQQRRFKIRRITGTSGREMIVHDAHKESDSGTSLQGPQAVSGAFSHESPVGWAHNELGEGDPPLGRPVDLLALSGDAQDAVDTIRRWSMSKDWYQARGIPWRYGMLLEGPPGTGKSALTKAIGQELDLPIFYLDIGTMDNREFHKGFQEALSNSPSIVLIEDVDGVFHGRENVAAEKGKGLSFDCFLNTLSGVESSDGILLVMTTNDMTQIDSALAQEKESGFASRPGRIDKIVHMGALDEDGRRKLAQRIMNGCPQWYVDTMVQVGAGDTGAQFQLRCSEKALALYWLGVRGGDDTEVDSTACLETAASI